MNTEYAVIAAMAIVIILCILYIIVMNARINAMDKKIKIFCKGKKLTDLESSIAERFEDIEDIERDIVDIQKQLEKFKKEINRSYQKTSILRYDAYEEMGGKLSFVLCVLDKKNDGFLLNVVSSRDGSYSYVKEVIDAESPLKLTQEENEVLMRTAEKE